MDTEKRAYLTMAEVIEAAIRFERDSAEFYEGMVKLAEREEVRELLGQLRDEELGHATSLLGLTVSQDDACIQFPPTFTLAPFRSLPVSPGFDDMLDLAIDREVQSVELYRNAAALGSGSIGQLMQDLSKFEAIHVRTLKEMKHR